MSRQGRRRPLVLTIAGSDSGGGAGIQADIRAIGASGAFAATAITCLTAQNHDGVHSLQPTEPGMLADQIDAVCEGYQVAAVKTGMLCSVELVGVVVDRLRHHRVETLVVDPVMVATSGARLLAEDAVQVLVEGLLPLATVVTPNLREAEAMAGLAVCDEEGMRRAARAIHRLGPSWVLVKGGHLEGSAVDILFDGHSITRLESHRVELPPGARHGTGCTLASAIAANLALGMEPVEAIRTAKDLLTAALEHRTEIGGGIAVLDVLSRDPAP